MIRLAAAGFTTGALGVLTLFIPAARTATPSHVAWVFGRPSPYGDLPHAKAKK